mgnify:CR=1 FL=1
MKGRYGAATTFIKRNVHNVHKPRWSLVECTDGELSELTFLYTVPPSATIGQELRWKQIPKSEVVTTSKFHEFQNRHFFHLHNVRSKKTTSGLPCTTEKIVTL